jgi:putative ABC transport system substrate-binding protein
MRTVNGLQRESLSNNQEISFLGGSTGGGECRRFLSFCKPIIYKNSIVTSWDEDEADLHPHGTAQWKESQLPARELGLQLHSMEVSSADKYESAFKKATKARSAALAVTADPLANADQKQIADLATNNRLPAIYPWGFFVDNGGLMSYGPNFAAEGRAAARLVDKILRGAKPADLPVEQPTKFELIINLKTAKQIGLTIPPNVLVRADKVIK